MAASRVAAIFDTDRCRLGPSLPRVRSLSDLQRPDGVRSVVPGDEVLLDVVPMEDMDLVVWPATRRMTVPPGQPEDSVLDCEDGRSGGAAVTDSAGGRRPLPD